MKFDIQPHEDMGNTGNCISLPIKVREELGVLIGQFLQLRGGKEVVLRVIGSLKEGQTLALISPAKFNDIQGSPIEFEVMEITLGCDPEFFILQGLKRVKASRLLPFEGQIGCDGELGELRPMYGKHEDQVVSNLRDLILGIPKALAKKGHNRNLSYEAHSYHLGIAAGFHVHLGIPPEILSTRKDFNRAAMNHLVRCLDWYVSVPLTPLDTNPWRRLGKSEYGKPGDYRPSHLTLEYRTPGAFYLRSPLLTRGLLGISLMVTENVVSRLKEESEGFLKLGRLTNADLQEIMPIPSPDEIRKVLRSKDTSVSIGYLSEIRERLRSLRNYSKHARATEEFFRAVEDNEQPEPGLLENWKE